jgi:hypothetical protein
MRKTLGVAALMLAFCCPALAGEMSTPPALAGEIPNPPSPESTTAAADGIMHGDHTDALIQTVITALISVLS